MPNRLTQIAARQRAELIREDEQTLAQIARTYAALYDGLQGDIDALTLAIQQMENPTAAQVKQLPQYKRLMRNAEADLDRFTAYTESTMDGAALAGIGLGLAHSAQLVQSMSGARFTGLQPGVMRPLLAYLDRDGPLYKRLSLLTGATVDRVVQTIIDGVGSGFNPRRIAGQIQSAFGGGLTDALRNTRTVQLYSYRDSARANYMASDGIVTGWVWYAELDADVCPVCAAQHGTIHELDEKLDGHYNCRCAALPYIEGVTNEIELGTDWFDNLPESQQAGLLGQTKYEAWKDGKFGLSDLVDHADNEVYGTMVRERSLAELIGE